MTIKKLTILSLLSLAMLTGCKNRDVNEGEVFRPREIHEDIAFHFDKITVDGIEYLILEKDNNNPHEGFGFMAFRANKLMEKQDTVLAYLRTIHHMQTRMYALLTRRSMADALVETDSIFNIFMKMEEAELRKLEEHGYGSTNVEHPGLDLQGIKPNTP